ncbi:hypothetical protein XENTR_v10002744 [Xenopus tropicalis]|uniref:DNA-directed RNA polymerase III subunit RPC7 isoform X1 n=1 Tax=Xenopus tropicalis TaxID=8364 RepID=A0A8J1IXT8_XENTR|nr:DNA-directed RNA polymerase III subunit RPC7 isoform X1 [Xenopus tropicalis]KAE8635802.1 hypothetical protein XENTR_v10002744 [Xenopus tropicalis]KAE8635803.1 hypothetical protein XENTR_v10002744 [Xenopus tropicalis]|eukprot:XP_002942473.1 PREDICTED: DNA-directed RNA polymerase III subunit RPC7 isoform X1 [Xenopus tropicalis]
MAAKGRGRAAFTFDIQAIGFSRGESLPETQLTPLPIFPSTEFKPVPLKIGEDQDYILALKQEMRKTMKCLPYYMGAKADKQSIERYSKKYEIEAERKLQREWTPDWRILPREMKAVKTKKKKSKTSTKQAEGKKPGPETDILKKIEELEKKGDGEEKSDEETEKKKEGEEGEEEEEGEPEIEDEEEHEEENDYISSYFDNGDAFEGSDDNMDEATY